MSPKATEKEGVDALPALSTPIKSKGKRQRYTPLYFRTRRSTKIKQGRHQTPTNITIILEESLKEQYNLVPLVNKGEEGTSQ